MYLAEAAVAAGRVVEAREIFEDLEAIALVTPSPLLHAQLRYARPAFAARLGELPVDTRHALLVATVDSDNQLAEILTGAAVLSTRPETAGRVEILDPSAAAGLIRIEDTRLYFRHPLVRSGVLQSESVHRRQSAHAALAAALEHEPSDAPGTEPKP